MATSEVAMEKLLHALEHDDDLTDAVHDLAEMIRVKCGREPHFEVFFHADADTDEEEGEPFEWT